MITIKIAKADDKFQSLEIKGHANSAPYGKDLVCAGVSAILIGGLNNIQNPKDLEIKLDEGHSLVKALKELSAHDEIVMETIICGLKSMEEENKDFIKVKAE